MQASPRFVPRADEDVRPGDGQYMKRDDLGDVRHEFVEPEQSERRPKHEQRDRLPVFVHRSDHVEQAAVEGDGVPIVLPERHRTTEVHQGGGSERTKEDDRASGRARSHRRNREASVIIPSLQRPVCIDCSVAQTAAFARLPSVRSRPRRHGGDDPCLSSCPLARPMSGRIPDPLADVVQSTRRRGAHSSRRPACFTKQSQRIRGGEEAKVRGIKDAAFLVGEAFADRDPHECSPVPDVRYRHGEDRVGLRQVTQPDEH